MSASLIGRLGSSAFRLPTTIASMSLTGLAHGHWPIGIYGMSDAIPPGLFRFDASRPDHLRPLHRFVCDELGKLGRRAYQWRVVQVRDPRLDLGSTRAAMERTF